MLYVYELCCLHICTRCLPYQLRTHTHHLNDNMNSCDVFTVCKIEAGRAILMSQEDFEIIEFPAKLIPKEAKTVRINIENREMKGENTERMLNEIVDCYEINEREIERFREEIGSESFLQVSKMGSTAAIINWDRPFQEIFGYSVKIETAIIKISCTCNRNSERGGGGGCYCEEYLDYVRKGLIMPIGGTSCRISLPIDLKLSLLVKSSVGYFESNEVTLKSCKFEGFSGVFVVSDLESETLEMFKEQGGHVTSNLNLADPVTAIVLGSFDSELFASGIENNLPVVSGTWIEALLANGELPRFEDHLLQNRS